MRTILLPKPANDSLVSQLTSLYAAFRNIGAAEVVDFDLNEISFACPFLVLPVSAYIATTGSSFSISDNSKVKSYLNTVGFPSGINSISELQAVAHKTKSYIPISVLHREEPAKREQLESLFQMIVYKKIVENSKVEGISNAIYYPITELVTNIFEHSKENLGFVFGQFHQNINSLDICIVDRGRGLASSYKEEKNLTLSDSDAIIEAMKGNSTKPDKERGYGIRTSKDVVCKALNGEFVLISGSSALVHAGGRERIVSLPGFSWKGVIIGYRIPVPTHPIDITPYLE